MIKKNIITTMLLFALIFSAKLGYTQNVSFIPTGGVAKAFGEDSEYWKLGFSVGAHLFFNSGNTISYGVRTAFTRLSPNGQEVLNLGIGPSYDYDVESSSGGFTMYEIVPTIQIATSTSETQDILLFFQVGGGLFMLKTEAEVKGIYRSPFGGSVTTEASLKGDSVTKPGIQVGASLSFKRKIMIQPIFSLIFTEGNTTMYSSINLGFIFGK